MNVELARNLGIGDVVQVFEEPLTVAARPEVKTWQGRSIVRISVKDAFGKTKIIEGCEIERRVRKAA